MIASRSPSTVIKLPLLIYLESHPLERPRYCVHIVSFQLVIDIIKVDTVAHIQETHILVEQDSDLPELIRGLRSRKLVEHLMCVDIIAYYNTEGLYSYLGVLVVELD